MKRNQTGQSWLLCLVWSQGTFALCVVSGDGEMDVTREVDGGCDRKAYAMLCRDQHFAAQQ